MRTSRYLCCWEKLAQQYFAQHQQYSQHNVQSLDSQSVFYPRQNEFLEICSLTFELSIHSNEYIHQENTSFSICCSYWSTNFIVSFNNFEVLLYRVKLYICLLDKCQGWHKKTHRLGIIIYWNLGVASEKPFIFKMTQLEYISNILLKCKK